MRNPSFAPGAIRYIRGMYVLDGGPRAGQLVDDLPEGYVPPAQPLSSFEALVIGDIPAAVAVWGSEGGRGRARLHRVE